MFLQASRSFLFCLLVVAASSIHAERYQVIEDRFGNLDAERSARTSAESNQSSDSGHALPNSQESSSQPDQFVLPPGGPEVSGQPAPETVKAVDTNTEVSNEIDERNEARIERQDSVSSKDDPDVGLGKFERVFFQNEGKNPYDATVVNEADFVDGDELLEGRLSGDSQQPFFITRDPDGNESITFYSPSLAQEAKLLSERKLEYSKATIYRPEDQDGVYYGDLPEQAEPIAVQILTSGKGRFENYFDAFSKRCCEELPKSGVKTLEFGRSEHLKLRRGDLPYRFNEGDSRYIIFKLPDYQENFAIQLRAFIRPYGPENVPNGIFFPQLVMLDVNLQPLRIISNPVLEYTPESWSDYGYLQGVFEVERPEGLEEMFVMLNTTRDVLGKISRYEHPEGAIDIRHMKHGELGVKAVYPGELVKP